MRVRLDKDSFKSWYRDLALQDRQTAIRHLNEGMLQFPSLFILMPEIESLGLYDSLNVRNSAALKACSSKMNTQELAENAGLFSSADLGVTDHETLKWMFTTGCRWDAPHADRNTYDSIMDTAAALLIGTYNELSILPLQRIQFSNGTEMIYIYMTWSGVFSGHLTPPLFNLWLLTCCRLTRRIGSLHVRFCTRISPIIWETTEK
jgi:hypothetical protein